MNNRRKSHKNFWYSVLGETVTIAIGLLLPRLYLVNYGSEVNGLLNSLSQFLVYLGLFEAGIGATTLQALYRPVAEGDWNGINGVLSATDFYYKRAAKWYFAALLCLSALYPLFFESTLSYTTVSLSVFFSGLGNVLVFAVLGKFRVLLEAEGKKYITVNLASVITILVNLIKVLLILLGCNIVAILAAAFVLQLLQSAYMLWYIRRNYPYLSLRVAPNHAAISQRNYMLIHQISGMIFQNTDVLILTVACGLRVVSVYAMFKLVITYIERALAILTNSVSFVLGQTFQTDRKKYIERIDLFETFYSAIAFALFSVVLYLLLPFIRLYTAGVTDVNYIDANLPPLFVAIALLTAMRTPMLCTINYAGHFKKTTPQTVFESALNLVVSLIGVHYFGIYGVLAGTIAALLYRTNDVIIYANRKILHRTPWRTYAIYLPNIAIFALLSFLYPYLFPSVNSYGTLLLSAAVLTVLSVTVFLLLQSLLQPQCRAMLRGICRARREKKGNTSERIQSNGGVNMLDEQQRGIILLIRSALTEREETLPDSFAPEKTQELIKQHQIAPLVYYGAVNCGIAPRSAVMQRFLSATAKNVSLGESQMLEFEALTRQFEAAGIDYMPLKGSVLKLLYPMPEMRTMSDIDILIRTEQYAKIKKIMRALGYREGTESDHELHWSKLDVHIELHKCLIPSYNEDYYAYFGDGWQRAHLCAVGSSRYQMTPEDEFIYLFCHFAKHYRDGGIGIKHLADLWVYRRHYPNLDEAYLRTELEKLSLAVFYDNITATCAVWFEAAAPSAMTEFISEVIFSSGAYGCEENHRAAWAMRNWGEGTSGKRARRRWNFERVFPPYQRMCLKYPILKKLPFLLPAFWVIRWTSALLCHPKNIVAQQQHANQMTSEAMKRYRESLTYVGLRYHNGGKHL